MTSELTNPSQRSSASRSVTSPGLPPCSTLSSGGNKCNVEGRERPTDVEADGGRLRGQAGPSCGGLLSKIRGRCSSPPDRDCGGWQQLRINWSGGLLIDLARCWGSWIAVVSEIERSAKIRESPRRNAQGASQRGETRSQIESSLVARAVAVET